MKKQILYCLVYRTGGTENFQWHRAIPASREVVDQQREEETRAGRLCYAVEYDKSMAIGLPSTYSA